MVESDGINDHEFFQMVFVRRVVPVPSYDIEWGEILPKKRDRGLPIHNLPILLHVCRALLFLKLKMGLVLMYSASTLAAWSTKPFGTAPYSDNVVFLSISTW